MFFTQKRILLAKEEGTYNVDPTPTTSANAIEAEKIIVSDLGDVIERNPVRASLSPVEPAGIGKRNRKITFDVELKGSGTPGTAARLGDLLEACGWAETVSPGSAVSYTPTSAATKSVTFYVYDLQDNGNALLRKITGARGTVQFNLPAGQIGKASFTFYGHYNAPSDVSAPSNPTFETTKPPIVESLELTLNGVTSLVVNELSFDAQVNVIPSDDVNSPNSIKEFVMAGRKPTGKFTPEAVTLAVYNFWTDWAAATARAFSSRLGSTSGNRIAFSAPKLTIDSIEDSDKQGILARDIPFRMSENLNSDEFVLIFT